MVALTPGCFAWLGSASLETDVLLNALARDARTPLASGSAAHTKIISDEIRSQKFLLNLFGSGGVARSVLLTLHGYGSILRV